MIRAQETHMIEIRQIPLSQLHESPGNVRRADPGARANEAQVRVARRRRSGKGR